MDMGFVSGTSFEVEKVAPLGDPVDILLRGCHVSIRNNEAKTILVERVDSEN